MLSGVAQSAGNVGTRPATLTVAPLSVLALPLQPVGSKSAPSPALLLGGGGRGEGVGRSQERDSADADGLYVHTPIGTSHPQVFVGSTLEWIEKERNKRRFKNIMAVVHSMAKTGREQQAHALMTCGRYFQRINFTCGTYKLVPHFCDSVFCPNCAARRSVPLQKKLIARIDQSKFDYLHIVVTVENWPELTRAGLKKFNKQFARLRKTSPWMDEIFGGVYSVEVTYNADSKTWHPHLHILAECKKHWRRDSWLAELKQEWKRLSGSHVINVERMYGRDKNGRETRKINMRSVKEIAKYATKSTGFSSQPHLVNEFLTAFESMRRMQSFGSFLGVVKEAEKEADTQANPETHKPNELVGCACGVCRWRDGHRVREYIHISKTVLGVDGSRQLLLFDSGSDPPVEVVSERTESDSPAVAPRAIPKTFPLFDVAPLAF